MNWQEILLNQSSAFATVLTAIVAIALYFKSKRDEIENAGRIIVLEIRESERILKSLIEIKKSEINYPDDIIKVVAFKGWIKYSHLFIKKMNNDEYDQISEYYRKCELLEKYLEKNHNFFWITTEERARQKESIGAALSLRKNASEFPLVDYKDPKFRAEVEKFSQYYFENTSLYSPVGIKTQIDKILDSVPMITLTPTWNKLKSIAKYNDILG
jgi:hypothetical protein